jgi:hypothetical protein
MKMMALSYDMFFSQTKLNFTIMGMLLATSLMSGKQKSHTDFQWALCLNSRHVCGLLHCRVVDYFTENTIKGNSSRSSNCLLSQTLKIL